MGLKELLQKCREYLKYREIGEKEGNISRVVIDNYKSIDYLTNSGVKKLTVPSRYRKEESKNGKNVN
jgi:hypothetical protein